MAKRSPKDPNPGNWPNWDPVRFVTRTQDLENAIDEWRAAGVLGIDTESNSFFAYHDRLCLVQISTEAYDYIVDPFELGDALLRINDLLSDPAVVKVFHSAEYDLMLLKKDLGAEVRGLFDTQVAMTLLHDGKTGLASLIESRFGLQMSKKEQRSNWGKRPLTEDQIQYARFDTHFLPSLYRDLHEELREADLLAAAQGEFERLEQEVLKPREPDMDGWRRLKGARQLNPQGMARLRALFQWRESYASDHDVPAFRVLANQTLVELAENPPTDVAKLAARKGLGWRKARQVGTDILQALGRAKGQQIDGVFQDKRSKRERLVHRAQKENQDLLRRWRKDLATELGIPSERLIHRRHLEEIGRCLPRTAGELADTVKLNDWQRENLEASLLELLSRLPDPEQVANKNKES